jgi:hypothetical protein
MPFTSINPTKTNPRTNSGKNKIEGTPILKLAMVERLNFNKNLSKQFVEKNCRKICQKIHQKIHTGSPIWI